MLQKRPKKLLWLLILLIIIFGILVFVKNTSNDQQPENTTTPQLIGPEEHIVGSSALGKTQANGIVVATNGATIVPSLGGILQTLTCSPGQEVQAGDVIAQLVPAQDLQTQNATLQKDYLGRQAGVLSDALNAGLQNIDIQIASLQDQRENNQRQLALLQQNISNLQQQKEISSSDLAIQKQSLQTQLDNLIAQQKTDKSKTNSALSTQIQAIQNNANAGLSAVDKAFGITNPDTAKYSKIYIGGKDPFGTNRIEGDYLTIKNLVSNLGNVSATQASTDIQTIISYFTLVTTVVNQSIVDSRYLPQTQIDALYSTFTSIANGLLQAKTSYDATVAGLDTIGNSYDSQIVALQNQLLSLDENKGALSDIAMDTQINGLQSQINGLQLAIDSYDNQLAGLQNSKSIQTQQTNGQLLTIQQNYQTLQNNLAGETLRSPIDGVVKMSSATVGNKVGPTTPLCIIGPKNIDGLKVQFFSSQNLSVGKSVTVSIDGTIVGTGNIDAKGSFVDPITQNYNYEIHHLKYSPLYTEGQKVTVKFSNEQVDKTVRIPLSFLTPRLNGNYVIKQLKGPTTSGDKKTQEINVEVGEINNNMIRILSGLQFGDIIQK